MHILFRRWAKIAAFLIPFLYIGYTIHNQASFQRFLNTLFITFDDLDPAIAEFLLNPKLDKEPVVAPPTNAKQDIPPRIHFIWFRDLYSEDRYHTGISHEGSKAPEFCREKNPGFNITVWDAQGARALLEKHYAWFLPTYDAYRYPIQRVDAFKYFVLLHHGGIYMDLDIDCRHSLSPLLSFPAWFPEASPLGVNNDLMASRAGHPVVKKMTEMLRPRQKNLLFPYLTIFWSTGPQFTSDILRMCWNEYTGIKYAKGSAKDLNPDWFYILPREFYSEQYTFFGHTLGGTWHGADVATVLWFVQRPWVVFLVGAAMTVPCVVALYRRMRRGKYTPLEMEARS